MSNSHDLVRKLLEGDGQPGFDLPSEDELEIPASQFKRQPDGSYIRQKPKPSEEMTELQIGKMISYLCQNIEVGLCPGNLEVVNDIDDLAQKLIAMHASSEDDRLLNGPTANVDQDEQHPSIQPKRGGTPERARRGHSAAPEETQGQ